MINLCTVGHIGHMQGTETSTQVFSPKFYLLSFKLNMMHIFMLTLFYLFFIGYLIKIVLSAGTLCHGNICRKAESVICDVIKIRLKRRDEMRSGKGNPYKKWIKDILL